jgi:hypothetical protein
VTRWWLEMVNLLRVGGESLGNERGQGIFGRSSMLELFVIVRSSLEVRIH